MVNPTISHKTIISANMTSSPTSDAIHPPVSRSGSHRPARGRNSSITHVRTSFQRRSTNIRHHMERKLLQMAETHMAIPLPLTGPQGLIFHVPELPSGHRPDSVVEVLSQSVNWLRDNPEQGRSPFTSSRPYTSSDLLIAGSDCQHIPILEPDVSHSCLVRTPTNIDFDNSQQEGCSDTEIEGKSLRTPIGVLIDYETQSSTRYPTQERIRPKTRTDIHPDLTSLISFFERRSSTPASHPTNNSRRPRVLQIQHPSIAEAGAVHRGVKETSKHTETNTNSRLPSALSSSTTYNYKPYRKVVRFAPTHQPPSEPLLHLNVGLQRTLPPSLTIDTSVVTAAASSTEFLDRKRPAQTHRNPETIQRTLSRKRDHQDLRALHQHQAHDTVPSSSESVQKQVAKSLQTHGYPSLTERRNRFEKSLPELPKPEVTTDSKLSARSPKRLGMYGPPPSWNLDGCAAHIRKDGHVKPFGEFQPYRPSRPNASMQQPPARSLLPAIPHIEGGSILREIKRQLFPDMDESLSTASTVTKTVSLRDTNKEPDMECGVSRPGQSASAPPTTAATTAPTYTPFSQTVARKGTLHQLGGKVVEIRKQFESETGARPQVPTELEAQPHSSKPSSRHGTSNRRAHPSHLRPLIIPPRSSSHPTSQANDPSNSTTTFTRRSSTTLPANPPPTPARQQPHSSQPTLPATLCTEPHRRFLAGPSVPAAEDQAVEVEAEIKLTKSNVDVTDASEPLDTIARKRRHEWAWKRFVDVEWDERERREWTGKRT